MRKSIILAVVLMAALVAVPAFASVQNVKVSGDVDSTWLYRNNFDLDSASSFEDISQSVFMTQTRLRVDADLTDQVSATVALINERAWGNDNASTTPTGVDLNLAYVTLREMLYSPLTVVAGRQVFSYGNSLIVDATGTNNVAPTDSGIAAVAEDFTKQSAMDAVRLIFDYNPLTLELLYAKIDENTATIASDVVRDDIDLYGINTTYELGDDMNTQVEAYFFARIDKSPDSNDSNFTGTKSDTVYVPGLRASADVLDGLNIQGEVAWQRGTLADTTGAQNNQSREAFAAQFVSNYQIPNDILPDALEEYNPVLGYTYTYVSGDSNPTNVEGNGNPGSGDASEEITTAWDPMFENQGGGTIYNTLFNLTNLQIHTVSLTANPIEDVTAKVSWHGLWLDKELDTAAGTVLQTLQRPDGTGTYSADASNEETGLGYEIDVDAIYDYTEDVQIGASLGWFVPGDVFDSNDDKVASQAIVHGIVNF